MAGEVTAPSHATPATGRLERLRARTRDESGVMLVITAILLVVLIGFAALAIDVGSFYQAQRQAQAAADAGALAGADDLAAASGTAAATTDAQTMAAENYGGLNSGSNTVNASTNAVTVTVSGQTPSFFGRIFGLVNANVKARAVAAVNSTSSNCSSGGKCYAIFGDNSSCSTYGIVLHANDHIDGSINSNGSIDMSGGNDSVTGSVSVGSGCSVNSKSSDTYGTVTYNQNPLPWPIDYSKTYPACSTSGPVYCTGPSGTPSYCANVYSTTPYVIGSTGTPAAGIDCFPGSGTLNGVTVKNSDPSTWNGAVSVGSGSTTVSGVTYICGEWDGGKGGVTLTPATGNGLLMYVADANGATLGTGNGTYTGDIFAPTGAINLTAGNNSTNFLEGQTVVLGVGNLTITGDGPVTAGGGGSTSGLASLTQ